MGRIIKAMTVESEYCYDLHILEKAMQRKFRRVETPTNPDTGTPKCVKCESKITSEECLQSTKRDGFYLHLECGEHIGVEVVD